MTNDNEKLCHCTLKTEVWGPVSEICDATTPLLHLFELTGGVLVRTDRKSGNDHIVWNRIGDDRIIIWLVRSKQTHN